MPLVPTTLGGFRVVRRIGSGGMAEVFLAERLGAEGTSKRVVVKRIRPDQRRDARHLAMFVREARIATRLDHPNVVHVHELSDHPSDGLLLTMEYVEGADLATVLAAMKAHGERVPPYVAAFIVREAAKGLHYAHEQKDAEGAPLEIVHRDVSPQNILLSTTGAVKIGDLGVATARLYRGATTGVKGKLRYMAPEQAEGGPVDRRADVYALGIVLYEALRLASPYGTRDDAALLRAARAGRFEPPLATLLDVPEDLRAVIKRALALDPADRFPTARALGAELSRAIVAQQRIIDETAIEALVSKALAHAAASAHEGTATVVAAPGAARLAAERPMAAMLAPGAKVGRYVIEEQLGRGGMADVYGARDPTLDRRVALKILRNAKGHDARRRLLREAKLAAGFTHPGSVVIYDVGEEAGVGFIAMELVRGVPLSEVIGDRDVPIARRVRWLVGAARTLAAAHEAGLIHRDVKPNNLMIREGGDVKVLDFGIARAVTPTGAGEPSSSGGSFVGTLRYAAPECFESGPIDGRADQFSWGVTAWELLAGRHPFDGDDALDTVGMALLEGVGSIAEAAPEVPAVVAAVVDRALSRRPEDRFASLEDAAEALDAFAEPPPTRQTLRSIPESLISPVSRPTDAAGSVSSTRISSVSRGPTAGRRRWVLAWAAIAIALVPLAVIALHRRERGGADVGAALGKPRIEAIACSDARVEGDGEDLARAIGRGACARLATELGVPWASRGGAPLDVRAKLGPESATITLRLAGREATASGAAPIAAMWSAIGALAPELATAPWTRDQIRLWGARDEASARRIQRAWQRSTISVSADIASEVARLLETDGDSPLSHLLTLTLGAGGREAIDAAPARIEQLLDRVPPARAKAIRAFLVAFPAERNRAEASRLFREAYEAAPDDHAMAALYGMLATRMGWPEASEIIDRLHEEMPGQAIGPLAHTIWRAAHRDEARDARYFAWLDETLPEASSRLAPVTYLASVGRFDDARAALDRGRRLGLAGTAADPMYHATASAHIALAALEPATAREHTGALLADPRLTARQRGGEALIASYLLEGRLAEAEAAMRHHTAHHRDQGNVAEAALFSLSAARVARWLDRPLDPMHVAAIERVLAARDDTPPQLQVQLRVELLLARSAARAHDDQALRELEAGIERDTEGDPLARDRGLCLTLPLVRAVRGDRAAAARYRETARAPWIARRAASLDAALALEAIGAEEEAARAYGLAADPTNNAEDAGQRALAIARLARRDPRRAAVLDRLWAGADAGLRKAVSDMR